MGYMRKRWWCVRGCQVMEYHTRKSHPKGMKREGRSSPTSEQKQKANQREKERHVQRLMMANFGEDDKYITLTYAKGREPGDFGQCQKDMKALREHLGRIFRKAGRPLKWIQNIELTVRGICHIHFLVNSLPGINVGRMVREWWKGRHGAVVKVENTYLDGGFGKLAQYMAKTRRDKEGNLISRFSRSRNLADPEPEVREFSRWNVMDGNGWREVRIPKGYELVKESVYEGVDLWTGFPYRYYTLLKQEGG